MEQGYAHLGGQLLQRWQRDFPLVARPFEAIAQSLGVSEAEVIAELRALIAGGAASRVGGVVKPNTLGASTLFAMQVPDFDVARIAGILAAEPGVNHIYLRENDWNVWSVATGPDRAYIDAVLARLAERSGCRILDLRLERPFYIDLGFALDSAVTRHHPPAPLGHFMPGHFREAPGDRQLVQALTDGLALHPRPFLELARALGRTEDVVIARFKELVAAGIVPRIGVIVRHRSLGWRSNAMVVWDVPQPEIEQVGLKLAQSRGVNLCYQRTRYADTWPYNLYCMVHARSRDEAMQLLQEAEHDAGLAGVPRQVLFSLRCFKQTGALLTAPKEAA